jgi:hypothetical protein
MLARYRDVRREKSACFWLEWQTFYGWAWGKLNAVDEMMRRKNENFGKARIQVAAIATFDMMHPFLKHGRRKAFNTFNFHSLFDPTGKTITIDPKFSHQAPPALPKVIRGVRSSGQRRNLCSLLMCGLDQNRALSPLNL